MRSLVFVEFGHMPRSPEADLAARRRVRYLEPGHPTVREWHVYLQAQGLPGNQLFCIQATTCAHTSTGIVRAQAEAHDAFGALRLAFDRLALELDARQRSTRGRAAAWAAAVARRLRPGH